MNAVVQKEKNRNVTAQPADVNRPYFSPDVNIFESENGFTLEAEMPGVNRDSLEVTLEGNSLTIVGRRTDEHPRGAVLYRESRPADFRRVFELDPSIDASHIRAQMNQGVLTLELPKTEAVKPRKVAVE